MSPMKDRAITSANPLECEHEEGVLFEGGLLFFINMGVYRLLLVTAQSFFARLAISE